MRFSGKRVEMARHSKDWTQADLAFRVRHLNPTLKPDASAIGKIEREDHEPKANFVAAIAQATGHDIEFFYEAVGDEDEPAADLEAALRLRAAAHRKMGEAVDELVAAADLEQRATRS